MLIDKLELPPTIVTLPPTSGSAVNLFVLYPLVAKVGVNDVLIPVDPAVAKPATVLSCQSFKTPVFQ